MKYFLGFHFAYTCALPKTPNPGQNHALQMGKRGLCSCFSVVYFPIVRSSYFTFFPPTKLREFLSWAAIVVGMGVTEKWRRVEFGKDPCHHFLTWSLAGLLCSSFFKQLFKKKNKNSCGSRTSFCGKCASWLPQRPPWARPAAAALCPWRGGPGRRHFRRPLGSHFRSCPRAGLLAAKSCRRSVPRHSWQWR